MSVRLLAVCGLFAIAGPVSAQTYNDGYRMPIDNRYELPHYGGHHHHHYHYEHRSHFYDQPHNDWYEYVVPESPVIIESHIDHYGRIRHENDAYFDGFHHDLHGEYRDLPPQNYAGRPQEFSRGRQVSPPDRSQFPTDGQFLEPPELPQQLSPRSALPDQTETPLGDGPPPSTVPTSSLFNSPLQNK